MDEAFSELNRLYDLRASGGGKIGPDETIAMVTEALEMWDSEEAEVPREEIEAAMSEARALLAPGTSVWAGGLLSYDQLMDVMEKVMKKVSGAPTFFAGPKCVPHSVNPPAHDPASPVPW